jgi:hypothetical protein
VAVGSSGTKEFDLSFWPHNNGLTFFSTGDVSLNLVSSRAMTSYAVLQVTATGGGTFGVHETAGHDLDF